MRTFRGVNLKGVPPEMLPAIRALAEWSAPASRALANSIEKKNNPAAVVTPPIETPPNPNPTTEFLDSQFRVKNGSIFSKQLAFNCGAISASTTRTLTVPDASGTIALLGVSAAPVGAKYIVQTTDPDLTNEQALGALATGILKSTTATGVLSIAGATDLPDHTHAAGQGGNIPESSVTSLVADLAAKEATANKNAASGYAGLDGSSKLTGSQQVYGSAVNTACVGNDSRLSDARTPTAHATSHKSGGSDSIKLDEFAAPTDVTTLNADTSKHGLLPKLGGGTTNFLRADGTWASPGSGSAWTTVTKGVDEATASDTTLSNDAELTFAMVAGLNYSIRLRVYFDTVAAADFKYAITGPAATVIRCSRRDCPAGGTPAQRAIDLAYPGSTSLTGAGTNGGYVEMDMVVNSPGNGTFAFQWAQQTGDASDTSVLSGSYLEYLTY
jgi:hypothetical protein